METQFRVVEVSLMGEGKVLVTFSDEKIAILESDQIYSLARDLQMLTSPPAAEDRD
jgi:hypothetical protein